jgi:hypothetical protein
MTPNHAPEVDLALEVIENDLTKAVPLLRLLTRFAESRGDPLGEAMITEVLLSVYLKTEHCENSMRALLSEATSEATSEEQPTQAQLVA